MLIEETVIPDADLPVSQLRSHLRLGSGFEDEAFQDPVLVSFLRAAVAAIEARTGKILYKRGFLWSVSSWKSSNAQELPVAPVQSITQVALVARDGSVTELDLADVRLERSMQAPRLASQTLSLPPIPTSGHVDIRFIAGWSAEWAELPADLAHAVLLLAAHYYEFRAETSLSQGCMPFGVSSLIERYRNVRIGFGDSQ